MEKSAFRQLFEEFRQWRRKWDIYDNSSPSKAPPKPPNIDRLIDELDKHYTVMKKPSEPTKDMEVETGIEKHPINTDSLKDLAIYLEGVKHGKGNLLPLGTVVLEDLWNTISYLRGDVRFTAERDKDQKE